ncbi:hypothetical protein ABI59_23365 [Acidobacteria bacterium Mor1]|nr:hypothetical protein ABI59_23365 [Acidobacteria bacterium Mor1]
MIGILVLSWLAAVPALAATAGEGAEENGALRRLLIDYDSSNSMWGELADKTRKYEAGRTALADFLASELGEREIAFRAYGHRDKTDCRDSELIVPFSAPDEARTKIAEAVAGIRPKGKTPITYSLRQSLEDLGGVPGDILLISDGIETCDIDPCELMRQWREANVGIRVFVVGVGLTDLERQAMNCIAEESGGAYFDADSADDFAEALSGVGEAIETPAEPATVERGETYALLIKTADAEGRSYVSQGRLLLDGAEVAQVGTHKRNVLDGPGEYTLEIGPLLADDTTFEPVTKTVSISEPGETTVEVQVLSPSRVTSRFVDGGEEQHGSLVYAYLDGEERFRFRPSDEALARPGNYTFKATPNDDNELSVDAALTAGEHTEVLFEMTSTVTFTIVYELPDGTEVRRGSELWRDGERLYKVFSGNPTRVRPGVYELRSDDQNAPLKPRPIEIRTDGEEFRIALAAGFVVIRYAPSEWDYVRTPDRAFLESIDRGKSKYASLDVPIPVAPGRYRANPHSSVGFMDPVEVTVGEGETVEAVFQPKKLGEIVVEYAPSDGYKKTPDRASVYALEGQPILKGFMRPGKAQKFLPGRYKVDPMRSEVDPVEIVVKPHERTTVTLKPR